MHSVQGFLQYPVVLGTIVGPTLHIATLMLGIGIAICNVKLYDKGMHE